MTTTQPYELVQVSGSSPSWLIRSTDTGATVQRFAGSAAADATRSLDALNNPQRSGEPT